ncbi:3726_t:CDS:1, partial [Dentiscutata heterogama]
LVNTNVLAECSGLVVAANKLGVKNDKNNIFIHYQNLQDKQCLI